MQGHLDISENDSEFIDELGPAFDDEMDDEFDDEFDDELDDELDDEADDFLSEMGAEFDENELDEETEIALASELLEIETEEELDYFFGKLFRKIARGVKRFGRSKLGRKVFGHLKKIAKKALPILGNAIAPGIGGKLGSVVSGFLEIDYETMSPEDAEFEAARKIVRLSAATIRKANRAQNQINKSGKTISTKQAAIIAKKAIKSAAKKHAPGLTRRRPLKKSIKKAVISGVSPTMVNAGRWVRRGRRIILYL